MAKRVLYNCDRCGAETSENKLFTVYIKHRNGREIIAPGGNSGEQPDLCGECVEKVIQHVTNEWPEGSNADYQS